ncbi:hypothetical protein [Aeromicrobium piscarium]|uniref:Uncharacterized protein n=1 Tax=Aeromicrobium piscarium TaxID=2590901 RepID=A0A554RX64_9ACTN|nr:hypothetical protein [Aeromicrobium piscarium]TSD58674.1 hypothetical protein FNM00_13525 [Aeromicrobium piscarium]
MPAVVVPMVGVSIAMAASTAFVAVSQAEEEMGRPLAGGEWLSLAGAFVVAVLVVPVPALWLSARSAMVLWAALGWHCRLIGADVRARAPGGDYTVAEVERWRMVRRGVMQPRVTVVV